MSEPAEAIQLARPAGRRRRDLERRLGVDLGQPSGQSEMTVVKLGGEARVGGSEFLRRQQKLLGTGARGRNARNS
jgi:hypothetical protein